MDSSEKLIKLFTEKGITIATAESCTGGMIAEKLTDISGSSAVILGGVVSYAVCIKENVINVPSEIIDTYGVVSTECAAAMAEGVRKLMNSTIAVSTTGVAGPTGGTESTPVGTVCFGLSVDDGTTISEVCYFGEDKSRKEIRELASEHALELALNAGENYNA